MCGVAGLYLKNGKAIDEKVLEKFSNTLRHRGPDGQASFIHKDVGLVHTRLSIIDLEGGAQPLTNTKGQALVANGEIYNHVELRERWKDRYPFQTQCDSETILASYVLSSNLEESVKELRGMYAFALYDRPEETLILSRDPFGIKPLYYFEDGRGVAFASEIKTLLESGWCSRTPDLHSIAEILQLRYGTGAETPLSGIKRLLPGETVVVRHGSIVNSFITGALPTALSKELKEKEALEQLKAALKDSVHVHLRSDVPYGLFLSGGLDSATILSLMSKESPAPVRTFTIGFANGDVHDERVAARKLSAHFGTEHEELTFSESDFWGLLPQVVEALDDPIFDPAMMPTFKMAKRAAQELKVILCGEGGDELLAGYRRYQKVKWPQWMGGRVMRQKGLFEGTGIFQPPYTDVWNSQLLSRAEAIKPSVNTKLQWAQAIDMATWLPNNLLTKLDRCLMAHSLEGRTPFLDPVVAAASYGLPDSLKVRRQWGKWILRHWMEKDLELAEPFTKKRGFNVPVGPWVLKYKKQLADLLPSHEAFEGLCDRSNLKSYIQNSTKDQGMGLWSLLIYALWYQRFIQGKPLGDKVFDALGDRSHGSDN
ncbi:MAG: asparagine synthase (glutamine-hydrolyzing) [bacterium]|nr:asparagine synthase (glutamine-hydrolyzing) [bacterium]